MCSQYEGFLGSDDWRRGFIKPLGSPWLPVQFANVDGMAVYEGCILLGLTNEVEESRFLIEERAKSVPEILTEPGISTQGLAIKGRQYRWPNRTIPFQIDPAIANKERIHEGMRHWEDRTSVAFRARTSEPDYVFIRRVASGCASHVGRQGGRQDMILSDDCVVGNIIHELGHAIGLWHEHSRSDRDEFIEVVYSQIMSSKAANFDRHIDDGVNIAQYDLGSIMHYPPNAFGLDGAQTIKPRAELPPSIVMGQRSALSEGDIRAVETIYAEEPLPHG